MQYAEAFFGAAVVIVAAAFAVVAGHEQADDDYSSLFPKVSLLNRSCDLVSNSTRASTSSEYRNTSRKL